ncbi:TrmH family RNA methyltransferase [Listeria costaricensis]|uniref:TrmH family RNA methyltransferase n=1 Tax=Listeria costaricensis TaxID=2026604 RepID=UPI000C07762A|nr:RNA methyltransferase [Listeria costaricensis]
MEIIQSTKNERIKQLRKLQMKKEREATGTYLIEGFHLVEEALKQDGLVQELLALPEIDLQEAPFDQATKITRISREVAHFISETKSEQGIFAVVKMTEPSIMMLNGKKLLLVDRVQDPGNIGTLIRTADAAGYDAVVLGAGSADLYNPKVIRSAQGSHFHLPVLSGNLHEWVEQLKEEDVPVYGAILDQEARSFEELPKQTTLALMVGNEGQGIDPELIRKVTAGVYIPIYGASESLNVGVAAGILMYGLAKYEKI